MDEKAYGFNDIEQHKFDWAKKIVRIEVDRKILESEQLARISYRAFLKDTATPNHYGIVEFPYDALVELGFLKKIVSGTHAWEAFGGNGRAWSNRRRTGIVLRQVIPIGEKPAARAVVGRRETRSRR